MSERDDHPRPIHGPTTEPPPWEQQRPPHPASAAHQPTQPLFPRGLPMLRPPQPGPAPPVGPRAYQDGRPAPPWPAPGPPPAPTPGVGDHALRFGPPPRPAPTEGWRLLLHKATFGLVNLGPSPEEQRIAALEAMIRTPVRGNFRIGVLGKGGVGKTTVAASIGSVFAELRHGDRVVAVDADTAFGKLGSRVDPKAAGSYWELVSDSQAESFADIRSRVGNNAAGLFVLAGEAATVRRRVLEPAVYREAAARLNRHFTITIVDCGSSMDSAVMQEVLRDLDALVVVSSPWVDGATAAAQTIEWLADKGLNTLLSRTVVVLNDSDGHADKRTRSVLAQQFVGRGQAVIEVPFDPHLRPGGVIDTVNDMARGTRRKFIEIAGIIAQSFGSGARRSPGHPNQHR